MSVTNFQEYVRLFAEEAPHALALDWFRRLELAMRSYLESSSLEYKNGRFAEAHIERDPLLGKEVAAEIRALRRIRNEIAHTGRQFSTNEATSFASEAFSLIGVLWRAEDTRAA